MAFIILAIINIYMYINALQFDARVIMLCLLFISEISSNVVFL